MDQVNSIFIYLENTHGSGKFNIYLSGEHTWIRLIQNVFIWRTHMDQVNSIFIYLYNTHGSGKFNIYLSGEHTWIR